MSPTTKDEQPPETVGDLDPDREVVRYGANRKVAHLSEYVDSSKSSR